MYTHTHTHIYVGRIHTTLSPNVDARVCAASGYRSGVSTVLSHSHGGAAILKTT